MTDLPNLEFLAIKCRAVPPHPKKGWWFGNFTPYRAGLVPYIRFGSSADGWKALEITSTLNAFKHRNNAQPFLAVVLRDTAG